MKASILFQCISTLKAFWIIRIQNYVRVGETLVKGIAHAIYVIQGHGTSTTLQNYLPATPGGAQCIENRELASFIHEIAGRIWNRQHQLQWYNSDASRSRTLENHKLNDPGTLSVLLTLWVKIYKSSILYF